MEETSRRDGRDELLLISEVLRDVCLLEEAMERLLRP